MDGSEALSARARKTVLVVDDDPGTLRVLAHGIDEILERFEVITAANGRDAVAILEHQTVDAIVTDLSMPVMDGFELIAFVTNRSEPVPMVVLSGLASSEIDQRLAPYGGLRVLGKPASYHDVVALLEQLLEHEQERLEGVALSSVVQLIEAERRSCALIVTSGRRKGRLYFESGRLINAFSDDFGADGEAAAYDILGWSDTAIAFDSLPEDVRRQVHTPLQLLLIEVAAVQDQLRERTERSIPPPPASAPGSEQPEHLAASADPLEANGPEAVSADSGDGAPLDGPLVDGAPFDGALLDGAPLDGPLVDGARADAAIDPTSIATTSVETPGVQTAAFETEAVESDDTEEAAAELDVSGATGVETTAVETSVSETAVLETTASEARSTQPTPGVGEDADRRATEAAAPTADEPGEQPEATPDLANLAQLMPIEPMAPPSPAADREVPEAAAVALSASVAGSATAAPSGETHVTRLVEAVERLTQRARDADVVLAALTEEIESFRLAQRYFDEENERRERRCNELEAFRNDVARLARQILGRVDELFLARSGADVPESTEATEPAAAVGDTPMRSP